jgi:hypothetical protein
MIRIGADFSSARKGLQGATSEISKFKRDTSRATSEITGKKGLGGIQTEFKTMGTSVSSSLSRIRGAKGISGVVSGLWSMRPALGAATAGLAGLGASAAGASAALGPVGVALAVITAGATIATVAIYKSSQGAVKFESDLGRLNMQLKGGSKDFIAWSRAQGLAKTTTTQLGSTYGVLLSSFIKDNKTLQDSTKQLVQATRVVASATGRTMEDTLERMRSGLLGNTEAIEDLGIFVGVSMIESTNAFKKFANGKSWDQIDFQLQQQIRLAAILEQTYSRYGDKLQNNVMTKQERLMEQFKDIKLHLSQTFLPIWDSVLPSLTALAKALADTTERVARFVYWIRGWDYDEMTSGLSGQTDATTNLGNSLENTADSAKKARKELAAFDQLNLIGESSSGNGGTGGTGGSGPSLPSGGNGGGNKGGVKIPMPELPVLPKMQLQFDPPNPPDAGAGAVATAVTGTINSLIADTKANTSGMWKDLQGQTQTGSSGVTASWSAHWKELVTQNKVGTGDVTTDWKTMLESMKGTLITYRPQIEYEWGKLKTQTESIKTPLGSVKSKWHETLNYMQSQLNAYRPYIEWGWHLTGQSVAGVQPVLDGTSTSWNAALEQMNRSTSVNTSSMVSNINSVTAAWESMRRTVSQPIPTPTQTPVTIPTPTPAVTPSSNPATSSTGRAAWVDNAPIIGDLYKGLDWIKEQTKPLSDALQPFMVPGAGIPNLSGVGSAITGQVSKLQGLLSNLLKGSGIPAFAGGGLVYGPTLAMVGDNRGAATDPEVIAPLSKLEDIIGNQDNREVVSVLKAILQAVKESGNSDTAHISKTELARAAASGINDLSRRSGKSLVIT